MKKSKDIEWKEVDGETIIVNHKKNKFFLLNGTASFIWKKISKKNTEKQIAESLAKKYKINQKTALKDTQGILKKFNSMKLTTKK